MPLNNNIAKSLWANTRDSIRHTLDHFFELSLSENIEERFHHKKWIVISAHHSAQTYSLMLLKEFEENHQIFEGRYPYPFLKDAVETLESDFSQQTTMIEKHLFSIFKKINRPRNKTMHGEQLIFEDISLMAMAIIGICRAAQYQKRPGESADDILSTDPPILDFVAEAIKAANLPEYTKLVEIFIDEYYPNEYPQDCLYCAGNTVVNDRCQACLKDHDAKICPKCDIETLVLSFIPEPHFCPYCGTNLET